MIRSTGHMTFNMLNRPSVKAEEAKSYLNQYTASQTGNRISQNYREMIART